MSTKVFVSHSTKWDPDQGDPDEWKQELERHRAFLENLCTRLANHREKGDKIFDVAVDYEEIKVSQHWRERLLTELGQCHAGIVLLNRKAITVSEWVHTEASVLRWRHWENPDKFPLIVLLVGDGSAAALKTSSRWRPLAFSEVQYLDQGREQTGATLPAAALRELVGALPREPPRTPFELMREQLEVYLHDAFKGDQDTKKQKAAEFAKILMEKGPEGLDDLVTQAAGYIEGDKGLEVIPIIEPWWVDPESACPLARAADKKDALRSFSVTGSFYPDTARAYLRQAFLQPPVKWKLVDVDVAGLPQGGQAFRDGVVARVRQQLIDKYRTWRQRPPGDAEIRTKIEERNRKGRPTFVALPPSVAGNKKVTDAITGAFAGVTLLHLSASEAHAKTIEACHLLKPLPDPEAERRACEACQTAYDDLAG